MLRLYRVGIATARQKSSLAPFLLSSSHPFTLSNTMTRSSLVVCALLLTLAACTGGTDLGPPADWSAEGTERWWRSDADTTGVFRNMETLDAMGVRLYDDVPLGLSVQDRLVGLYRTNPELVDSVFAAQGLPILETADPNAADFIGERDRMATAVNREMAQHYRQALAKPFGLPPVPDSLQSQAGPVVLQVYVDANGEPLAIEKIEGAHPVLDAPRHARRDRLGVGHAVGDHRRSQPQCIRLVTTDDSLWTRCVKASDGASADGASADGASADGASADGASASDEYCQAHARAILHRQRPRGLRRLLRRHRDGGALLGLAAPLHSITARASRSAASLACLPERLSRESKSSRRHVSASTTWTARPRRSPA